MFATGDRVVYPLHGGAIIKEIERREQDGAIVEYFISYFCSSRNGSFISILKEFICS